jgi:preprotein translocase SecE subunit
MDGIPYSSPLVNGAYLCYFVPNSPGRGFLEPEKITLVMIKKLAEYLRSSKAELEKVAWPSRKDTIRYSSLVLGVSVIIAVFFAGLDYGLNGLVTAMLKGRTATQTQQPPATEPVNPVPGLDISNTSGTFFPSDVNTNQP